jgi:hypothetical protein
MFGAVLSVEVFIKIVEPVKRDNNGFLFVLWHISVDSLAVCLPIRILLQIGPEKQKL